MTDIERIVIILLIAVPLAAFSLGYYIGHGIMEHACQDIVSSKIKPPTPIIYMTERR